MLPRIKINFDNGALQLSSPSDDGLLGILCTGAAVPGSFSLNTPYTLRSLTDVDALGINTINNPSLYKTLREFYAEAGAGTTVWLMAFADTVKHSDMIDIAQANNGKKLIDAAAGKLRGIAVSRTPAAGYLGTTTTGLDADIALAIGKAQEFAEYYTNQKYAPLFVLLEGYGYTGNPIDLADLTTHNKNRVSVLIGDTQTGKNAAIGTLAGRLAKTGVQRHIGRVADGPLAPGKTYTASTLTELADVESLHSKGYISFRTYIARSGYFFSDDFTATLPTDDYSHLTARRTVDKAFRIAYDTLLNTLLDEVPVNANGTLPLPVVKSWQAQVEGAIERQMTAAGELSADINTGDRGVQCFIDPAQNLVSSSRLKIAIRVRPFGYPRYVDVYLGFNTVNG